MSDNDLYTTDLNFKKADMIINVSLIILNSLIMVIFLLYFKSTIKVIKTLKYLLFRIFLDDIIIRLLNLLNYSIWTFLKEIGSSFINTFQFFFLLSFFEKIYSNVIKIQTSNQELRIHQLSLIFLLIAFPYDKLILKTKISYNLFSISIDELIIIVQSICALFFSYKLYRIMEKKSVEIKKIMKYDSIKVKNIHHLLIKFPILCLLFYSIYFLLIIIFAFPKDPIILLFGNISFIVIKNASKYFIYISCSLLLRELKKIKNEEENQKIEHGFLSEIQVILK
jgi:hypothetical protein